MKNIDQRPPRTSHASPPESGRHALIVALLCCAISLAQASTEATNSNASVNLRERLLMDANWRFAFGHATDRSKDFEPARDSYDYLAKAGNGAGAAAVGFDDRGWRSLNLPHDWAVELPYSDRGSADHGYKTLGRNFPENSVGWYRKTFAIPASDLGRRIRVEFDGVFRDSQVWINGFYLGREASGYASFAYDLTDYLNYGGNNVISVRVDVTLEEGWFYEGAGIYRHVWLTKTAPLHVAQWGTFVTSEIKGHAANVIARATVKNDSTNRASFEIEQTIQDAEGRVVAKAKQRKLALNAGESAEYAAHLKTDAPELWSPESPYLYTLITTVHEGDKVVDRYETPFGVRTLRWDANQGFFLNGQRVELKGVCHHQDHAGVGVALPDELQTFRLEQLKKMGCNAIRTSHNPPTPELLDACDRLGMLVLDENRSMGTTPEMYSRLDRFMKRDRNHPSVILWLIGNEEWSIEGNPKGTRITADMQDHARLLDTTRRFTAAISGGWGKGTSVSIDVMGFNYFTHGDTDAYHRQFPDKPCVATEDSAAFSTRGIYVEDRAHQHLTAYDVNKPDWGTLAEASWSHYATRPYVAGLFQWVGFDYKGEETPFAWPAISSAFGILDTCGFPKDNFYYYQAWWTDHPVLHLLPHWNWPGKEGQDIEVWAYCNCDEVELFLNGASQGRQTMKKNSHLEWKVKYAPGSLLARGYTGGKEMITTKVETTGNPAVIQLTPNRPSIKADGEDASVVTVQANDAAGRMAPTASEEISFTVTGPGKIIGVGNGDPSSHEPDQFFDKAALATSEGTWKRSLFSGLAQIIIQSTGEPGEITLSASSSGLTSGLLKLQAQPASKRVSLP